MVLRAAPLAAPSTPRILEGPGVIDWSDALIGDGIFAHIDTESVTRVSGYRVFDLASGTARHFAFPAGEGESSGGLYLLRAHELVLETAALDYSRPLYRIDPTTLPLVDDPDAGITDAGVVDAAAPDAGPDGG